MITKLSIHNYKGFINFEMECGRIVFLMGRNGSGKSSLLDVLHALATVINDGNLDVFDAETRFRFADEPLPTQKFSLEAELNGASYRYVLEIDFSGRELRPILLREELHVGGSPVFLFADGQLTAYGAGSKLEGVPFDAYRGALSSFGDDQDGGGRATIRHWASGFLLLRLVPGAVKPEARKPSDSLDVDGLNFVAWYETVSNDDTLAADSYRRAMREALPGLKTINLRALYKTGKLWEARFMIDGKEGGIALDELSEGQICLAVLYAILHFTLHSAATVALDEPDNYLALSEIEPYLHELEDATELKGGQLFVISHHPEVYRQWARDSDKCHYFELTGSGKFATRVIDWDEYPGIAPAEVVARGWQDA